MTDKRKAKKKLRKGVRRVRIKKIRKQKRRR